MELQQLTTDEVPPTLTTLPPDIVRLIIRAAGPPVESMRLISPGWNKMVLEFLKERRNHPAFEEVHLGGPENARDAQVSLRLGDNIDIKHFGYVCRGWTTNREKDTLYSPILRLRTITVDRGSLIILVVLFFLVEYLIGRFLILVSVGLLLLMTTFLAFLYIGVRPRVEENCTRLARIFERCSSISSLHLHNLDRETLDVIRTALKDVPVTQLTIYDKDCDADLRKSIVKMARTHKVEKIVFCVRKFEASKSSKLFLAVTATVKDLEIYESIEKADKIFGKPKEFWETKAQEMSDGAFSVQVMNGERLEPNEGTHLLRLKVGA